MNFNIGYNSVNAKCTKGHGLVLMSGRNARCDNCSKVGLFQSYACTFCNFDLCDICASNSSSSMGQTGLSTTVQSYCKMMHPLLMASGRNARCDVCGRAGLNVSYSCLRCNYDNCDTCYMKGGQNSNIINTGMNSGMNSGFNTGMNSGMNSDFNSGFDIGFNSGSNMNSGMNSGFNSGFDSGFNTGSNMNSGFNQGMNSGMGINTGMNSGMGMNTGINSGMGINTGMNSGMGMNTGMSMTTSSQSIPTGTPVKLYSRTHTAFVFVGHGKQENDHTVYACAQNGFQSQNFQPRTSIVIQPMNDGSYQIVDSDHGAAFFVGNSVDNGGDHTVYASPQKFWRDYNDFVYRTSFQFIPAEYGAFRIFDKKHSSYLFVGNSSDNGDHTVYSVPQNKYNMNPNEWMSRTLFDIKF